MKKYCPHCESDGIRKGKVWMFSCGSKKALKKKMVRSNQCFEYEIGDLQLKLDQAYNFKAKHIWNEVQNNWAATVYKQSKEIENLKAEIKKLNEVKP